MSARAPARGAVASLFLLLLATLPASLPRAADDAARAAAAPLAPFHGNYTVSRNGSALGKAEITLAPDGADHWRFVTATKGSSGLAGMVGAEITERTTFRWHDGLPELVQSTYRQKVAWKDKAREIRVDPAARTVDSKDEKRSGTLAYEPNLIDRHGAVLSLAVQLAQGRTEFSLRVVHRQKISTDVYRAAGTETVDTPAGAFQATRIERIREGDSGRTTTSWLAPTLGHMPVRIVQVEPDGERLEMVLSRIDRP